MDEEEEEEEEYSSRPLTTFLVHCSSIGTGLFFYSLTYSLTHSFIYSVSCVTVYGESPDRRQRPTPLVNLS